MATEKGEETTPARPPVPGDLPYRESPVIEGKAEEVHETRLEPTESAEGAASEPSPASMDEVKAAVQNALDANEPAPRSPPEIREPEAAVHEPTRSWPLWPLALAALIGLLPGLAALWLALQPRQDDTANAISALRGDVSRLAARVDALEKRPDASALRDTVAALDKRIAGAETLGRNAQSAADKAASDAATAATTAQKAADRPEPTASAPAAPPPDLSPLRQEIGNADARIGAVDQKVQGIDARLGALQAKIDQPKTDARALTADKEAENAAAENPASLAVVAQSVQQALARGTPFPTELSALKSLKADPAKIAALEPLAPTGAPTARQLADRFRPLADEIAREDQPREGSFFDRIAQSASHLVRIRSAGEKPGSDPAAIASQIQAALDRGDIAGARDLWTKLPDRAKARAADFGRALEARVAADNAAQALASESIARLAKPRS